jgi:3-deoxy-D-manno-octulosonate 8-phosphate phosphatase (KDO 8-P phosphatase)
VDGVLTDGRIVYDERGAEIKAFNVKDGLGIRLLMASGVAVGIVTGRRSKALLHRCENLGIERIYDGVTDKAATLAAILSDTGLTPDAVAFIGDDLPDLSILKRVGVAIAVADAHERIIAAADWVTAAPGGRGAVRQVCERLLTVQGKWQGVVDQFER